MRSLRPLLQKGKFKPEVALRMPKPSEPRPSEPPRVPNSIKTTGQPMPSKELDAASDKLRTGDLAETNADDSKIKSVGRKQTRQYRKESDEKRRGKENKPPASTNLGSEREAASKKPTEMEEALPIRKQELQKLDTSAAEKIPTRISRSSVQTSRSQSSRCSESSSLNLKSGTDADAGSEEQPEPNATPQKEGRRVETRGRSRRHYSFVKVIGKGSFGKVYRCTDRRMNSYAVKMLTPAREDDRRAIELQAREEELLFFLRDHPERPESIVEFIESFERPCAFKGETKFLVCLVFELIEGPTLANTLRSGPINDVSKIKTISKQVLEGLQFLHKNKIVHCDMKPENIMFKHAKKHADRKKYLIKIIDFGLAEREPERPVDHIGGTVIYHPPEVFAPAKIVSCKLDIWEFGVILWEMFNGLNEFPIWPMSFKEAFERKKDRELAKRYMAKVNTKEFEQELKFDTETWKKHPEAVPLAKGVLEKDHTSRFTAADALAIPWLAD